MKQKMQKSDSPQWMWRDDNSNLSHAGRRSVKTAWEEERTFNSSRGVIRPVWGHEHQQTAENDTIVPRGALGRARYCSSGFLKIIPPFFCILFGFLNCQNKAKRKMTHWRQLHTFIAYHLIVWNGKKKEHIWTSHMVSEWNNFAQQNIYIYIYYI